MANALILLAAGRGTRMRGEVEDKALARLAGIPVFRYSLRAFRESGQVEDYLIVFRDPEQRARLEEELRPEDCPRGRVQWVQGGEERRDSVFQALSTLPDRIQMVFIHDCARPLIQPHTIRRLAQWAEADRAVTAARPATDTHRLTPPRPEAHTDRCLPLESIDRRRLWAMETPQVFDRTLILEGYQKARAAGRPITDDAEAALLAGHTVSLLHPSHPNPKLTHPEDLVWVEFLLERHPEWTTHLRNTPLPP